LINIIDIDERATPMKLNEEIIELAILRLSGGNISVINENTIGFIDAAKIPVKNLRKTNK
jgi:hypothetical protein